MTGPSAPARQPFSWRRTWLIARREIRERIAQRVYRVVLLVGAVLVAGIVVVPTLIGGGGDDDRARIEVPVAAPGVSAAAARDRVRGLERAGAELSGLELRVELMGEAQARERVREGEQDLALILTGTTANPGVRVIERANRSSASRELILASVERAAFSARLAEESEQLRTQVLAPVRVQQESVASVGATPAAAAVVGVMTLVLYLAGLLLNSAFANGLVADRSGRIVERLLTAARPEEHLAGKLIGVGAAGLIQLVAWMGAGLLAGLAVAGSLADTFSGVPALLIVWFPIALVLTYVLYAALGAIMVLPVRRIEDVASALVVGSMLQIVAYIAATTIIPPGSTVGPLIQALSLVPFLSPLIMLPRIAAGGVAEWELAIALLGPIATAVFLIWLAGPAYARHAIDAPGGKGMLAALRALRT